ncbi:hypothetical protein EVAR_87629_1 [Eumeta japonica]|uniref:Uncharacterized protein n=1 Tax=Eumeta variegata TaxID=151549 RepID=A0A4C1WKP0_EUMVA|nr:hypothetical protein EVAR_87629_1 [Eumeta japonica]
METTAIRGFATFKRERGSIEDKARTEEPPTAVIQENAQIVEQLITENQRITYVELEQEQRIGSAAMQIIIHDHPSVCSRRTSAAAGGGGGGGARRRRHANSASLEWDFVLPVD